MLPLLKTFCIPSIFFRQNPQKSESWVNTMDVLLPFMCALQEVDMPEIARPVHKPKKWRPVLLPAKNLCVVQIWDKSCLASSTKHLCIKKGLSCVSAQLWVFHVMWLWMSGKMRIVYTSSNHQLDEIISLVSFPRPHRMCCGWHPAFPRLWKWAWNTNPTYTACSNHLDPVARPSLHRLSFLRCLWSRRSRPIACR